MPLGQHERDLFEEQASPLYEEIVTSGGISRHRQAHRRARRAARGLRAPRRGRAAWSASDDDAPVARRRPRRRPGAGGRTAGPAGRRADRRVRPLGPGLQHALARLASLAQRRGRSVRRDPRPATIGNFLDLAGQRRGGGAAHRAAAGPARASSSSAEVGGARDRRCSSAGCKMRTLYQHAARRGADTRKYVAAVTAAGAEVRTLDEFFNRLIVVDRRIAIIPSHEGLDAAMVISDRSMVGYLVDMFERHWERARPFTSSETSLMRDIAAEQRAMTIRMLLEGRADPAGAKRLGVSPRTYAGYVADLKNEFEVETRFQLGYEMGKRGISGRETRRPDALSAARRGTDNESEGSNSMSCCPRCWDGPVGEAFRTRTRGGLRGPCPSSSLRAHHGTTDQRGTLIFVAPAGVDPRWRGLRRCRRSRSRARPRERRLRCGELGSCWLPPRMSRVTGDDLFIVSQSPRPRHATGAAGLCIARSCKSHGSTPSRGKGAEHWRRRRDLNPRWGFSPKPA